MEREEAIKIVRNIYQTDAEKEALQALIPELAESEDERMRKLLVWQVHRNIEDETNDLAGSIYDGIKGHDPDLEESIEDWKKCLAWLEKQKEQGHPEGCFTCDEYKKGYEAGRFHGFTAGYNKAMKEQKPAEWSKNDTVFLNEITDFFENKTVKLQHDLDMYAHWLKSLPERFNLQPKKEWSKLDEEMRQGCIDSVEYELLDNGKDDEVKTDPRIVWLKSLRPQPSWKPSEEQMKALIDCTIGNEYDVHALVRLWAELKKL